MMDTLELLFEPMFRVPFLTGVMLAPVAAVLGVYLRLRGEWLAALAYAQIAAAGGLLALALQAPVLLGTLAATALVAAVKGLLARVGNDHFALLMLLGWGLTLAVASFSPHGEMLGRALMDGQLYFTGLEHLWGALVLLLVGGLALPWLSRRLLLARCFPDHFSANGIPAWPHRLLFDLLVVLAIALATVSFGVMAAFALIFVPAWVSWGVAHGWRAVLWLTAMLAELVYLIAFVLAIALDQPFGPVLVVLVSALAGLRLLTPVLIRRHRTAVLPSAAAEPADPA